MSVVAWDGYTLAADKRMTEGSLFYIVAKLWRGPRCAIGGVGDMARIVDLRNWYLGGADYAQYPAAGEGDDSTLIVVTARAVLNFTNSPVAVPILSPFAAWGAGAGVAMGAMACGKTAEEAVAIACRLCDGCGDGVDAVRVRRGRA